MSGNYVNMLSEIKPDLDKHSRDILRAKVEGVMIALWSAGWDQVILAKVQPSTDPSAHIVHLEAPSGHYASITLWDPHEGVARHSPVEIKLGARRWKSSPC